MSISISKYYLGNPSLASYALIFDGDGVEIASTGDYIQGTGISLTNVNYADYILQVDDIAVGDLVTAEVGYLDIYDSNDVKLIRYTFNPVLTLDHVEYTFLWPESGVDFITSGWFGNDWFDDEWFGIPIIVKRGVDYYLNYSI